MATTFDPTTADLGNIEKIDRTKLVIDPNVRKDVRLDKSFISSIRVRGFEQYPVGYHDDEGLTHITIGQRRISAALEIGWPVIPIVVKSKIEAEAARAEELRILTQLAENEQRTPLTEPESVAAYKQLALIGVTEEQIARKTNAPRQRITTALAVADSKAATKVLQSKPITLDQAALFVEFEADPDAVKTLTETAAERPEQLEHAAARIRQDRAKQAAVDKLATELEIEGWQIIRSQYAYSYTKPADATDLRNLYRKDGNKRVDVVRADVADLPDRIAVVYPDYGDKASATFFLKDPAKHGFESYNTGGTSKGPLTDDEKAARRQKRTDRADMTAATEVRRTWLRDTLIPRTHKLADVSDWIVKAMIEHPDALRYDQARDDDAKILTCELLGIELIRGTYSADGLATLEKALADANGTADLRVLLGFAIAKVEYPAGNPKHPRFGQFVQLAPYLLQLQAWGYTLADVEQRLVDEHTAAIKKAGKR